MASETTTIDFEPRDEPTQKEEKETLLKKETLEPETDTMHLIKKCLAEFMGTMFLCLTVALSVGMGRDNAPLAIGLSLGCLVFALGHISGANFNPAVSLAIAIRGRMDAMTAAAYMLSQVAGGFLGGAVARLVVEDWCKDENDTIVTMMHDGAEIARSCVSGYPSPDPNVEFFTAFLVETIFTMGLALVVLNVAVSDANAGNSFYGLAIGLTVTFGAIAGGGVSGGAFNPAVGIALPLIHNVTEDIVLYIFGPLAGGALAGLFFMLTAKRSEFMEKEVKKE